MKGTVSKRPNRAGRARWAYVFDIGKDENGKRADHEIRVPDHDVLGRTEALNNPFPCLQLLGGLESFVAAQQQDHRHANLDLRQLLRAGLAERLQNDRRLRVGLGATQVVLV